MVWLLEGEEEEKYFWTPKTRGTKPLQLKVVMDTQNGQFELVSGNMDSPETRSIAQRVLDFFHQQSEGIRLTFREIQSALGIEADSLYKALSRLVKQSLLIKRPGLQDKRSKVWGLPLSVNSEQSSVISHQSSVISFNSEQSSVTSDQLPVTSKQSSKNFSSFSPHPSTLGKQLFSDHCSLITDDPPPPSTSPQNSCPISETTDIKEIQILDNLLDNYWTSSTVQNSQNAETTDIKEIQILDNLVPDIGGGSKTVTNYQLPMTNFNSEQSSKNSSTVKLEKIKEEILGAWDKSELDGVKLKYSEEEIKAVWNLLSDYQKQVIHSLCNLPSSVTTSESTVLELTELDNDQKSLTSNELKTTNNQLEIENEEQFLTSEASDEDMVNINPSLIKEVNPEGMIVIDFGDVIVLIDEEMKRLGWDIQTGKTYLSSTYGKTSRHLLSDQELLEFLSYLQQLPVTNHQRSNEPVEVLPQEQLYSQQDWQPNQQAILTHSDPKLNGKRVVIAMVKNAFSAIVKFVDNLNQSLEIPLIKLKPLT